MAISTAATICFVACHAGPAEHFAVFAQKFIEQGTPVQVYASGPAVQKFTDRKIEVIPFKADLSSEEEASKMAKSCARASVVLTDVGHLFASSLQKGVAIEAPEVLRVAYYDNPEPYVPGGYSDVAAQVMRGAERVIFANAHLAQAVLHQEPGISIDLGERVLVGLGYYPVAQADAIAVRRENEKGTRRSQLLKKHGIKDQGQPVLVYFGGSNPVYFERAFPAFLQYLSTAMLKNNFSNQVIVLQQHPNAKLKNIDLQLLEIWNEQHLANPHCPKVIVSSEPTVEMQIVADAALYFQTSMGPLFALAGIPMVQVGHVPCKDIIGENNLCATVLSGEDLTAAIFSVKPVVVTDEVRATIFNCLGIKENWFTVLSQALRP